MPRPQRQRREIHRGVARLIIGGRRATEQEEAEKQKGERASTCGDDDEQRADRSHAIGSRKTRPPAAPMHDRGGRDGGECRSDDDGALRETRQPDAGQLGRQQRADGRPDRHPHPADDLGCKQQPQRAALDDGSC